MTAMQLKLIGPFTQIVTLRGLPIKGPIADDQLEVISGGGILINGSQIFQVGQFDALTKSHPDAAIEESYGGQTLIPGFIDCHTHCCFAGNRARDYAMRLSGKSYLEIAKTGGGIWDSVLQTRSASLPELATLTAKRVNRLLHCGTTTIEVKSGYGLNTESELKMLRAIDQTRSATKATLVSTCLAAHLKPRDFDGDDNTYLQHVLTDLLPRIREEDLANRVDIFIEESAFETTAGRRYLHHAKQLGFTVTVHADQFSTGGSALAVACGAASADHLEVSGEGEIALLATSETVAVVLPGASIGLGMRFAPARKLLDGGASVAIASDWNPGSAPMGELLVQAAILGAYERLTIAETIAGITFRAAAALRLTDRGRLEKGMLADMQAYPTNDYRDILYNQGALKPTTIWKAGERI